MDLILVRVKIFWLIKIHMNEIKINKVVKSKMGGCLAAERHGDVLMWRPGGPLSIKTCPTAQLMPNNRPELCKRDVEMAFGS